MIEKKRTYYVKSKDNVSWGEVTFEWYSPRTESFVSAICGYLKPSKEFFDLGLDLNENKLDIVLVDKLSEDKINEGDSYFSKTDKGVVLGYVSKSI